MTAPHPFFWMPLGVMLVCGTAASAQQVGSIRGVVYDADFDAPLPEARVIIVETGQEAVTGDQGNFVLGEVAPGTYTLILAKQGFTRQVETNVLVRPGQLTEISGRLAGDFAELAEFVVQDLAISDPGSELALLELRFDSPSLIDSIGADLMSQAGAGDAASALRLVSGASVRDDKAVIRGLPDRYVQSVLNKVRLPSADAETRAVELDQFSSSIIESIQVSKTFTPDQQGDASGGAVNVVTRSIPDEFVFEVGTGYTYNTQTSGRDDFLTYRGGGVNGLGVGTGRNRTELDINNYDDIAVGVTRDGAPADYSFDVTGGGKFEIADGVTLGGIVSGFYDRSASFFDNGVENNLWIEDPANPVFTPTYSGSLGDRRTDLFDITQGSEEVQWGGYGSAGIETEHHKLNVTFMHTRTTEDTATLAEDTRGKQFFFPGHDPDDPTTPGHGDSLDDAPYTRLETLSYVERVIQTVQGGGSHTLPLPELGVDGLLVALPPKIDWSVSHNAAKSYEPDKRQFGSKWQSAQPERTEFLFGMPIVFPAVPARHFPFKPGASFVFGNLQRSYEEIIEKSDQHSIDLTLPFRQWTDTEGYIKFGLFQDRAERTFRQETYSNFSQPNSPFDGDWDEFFSAGYATWPSAVATTAATTDIDYDGQFDIDAAYWMLDLPLTSWLTLIGGARYERTNINISAMPERDATILLGNGSNVDAWVDFDAGVRETDPESGLPLGDSIFSQHDVLPVLAFVLSPIEPLTIRGSYTQTVARQTFRELTPILQQEYLGGDIFIGNPNLRMSAVTNYDLRVDLRPIKGSLFSVSWFHKDIKDPIEYVQRLPGDGSFVYTTPLNFSEGELSGFEFEARLHLGEFWKRLNGLTIGTNATFIDSVVQLPQSEVDLLANAGVSMHERAMLNAPERLLNFNITYDIEQTGTKLGLFYTREGDTLIVGPGQSSGNFVPAVYATEYDNLTFTVSQAVGEHVKLSFKAKNLTDPAIRTVYRTEDGLEAEKSSFTKGIDFSFGISVNFTF